MKILFIGSNPARDRELGLLNEITEIQKRMIEAPLRSSVDIVFLPQLRYEELPSTLNRERPDIVHISSHADAKVLSLSNCQDVGVEVTAEQLADFFNREHPPTIAYINACNSQDIAAALVGAIDMAIGSTAPITNLTARLAAVNFYDRLLDGNSVGAAFTVCRHVTETGSNKMASMVLHAAPGVDPAKRHLITPLRIIAEFVSYPDEKRSEGQAAVRIGVVGCPPSIRQVVFFTDDESLIDDAQNLEHSLCHVVRESPVRGVIWADEPWQMDGDFHVFAAGTGAEGTAVFASSTICDALRNRLAIVPNKLPRRRVEACIKRLADNDGAKL